MKKLALYNWLILSISSLLVGIYISIFEQFLADKGWVYFVLAICFGGWYFVRRKN